MGWRPDARLAQQMALIRQTVVKDEEPHFAIVFRTSQADMKRGHATAQQLEGALAYTEKMGYKADVFNLEETPMSPQRLAGILLARGIQGMMFICTVRPAIERAYLEIGREFATSIIGKRDVEFPFHAITNDYLGACSLALKELRQLGYRRIGMVLPLGVDQPLANAYSGGFTSATFDYPADDRIPVLRVSPGEAYLTNKAFPEIERWLETYEPDVVLSTDVASLQRLRRRRQWDERFAIYSCDVDPDSTFGGINLRQRRLGLAAVDLIVAQLHRGEHGLPEVQRVVQVGAMWKPAGP